MSGAGPVAVVTGAARGIGRAIAARLAADGFAVVVLDVDPEGGAAAAGAVGGRFVAADVSDQRSLAAAAEEVGPVQVLVNNAGIWRLGPLLAQRGDDVAAVVSVNLLGTLRCTQAFASAMGPGGAIVNLSSAAAAMRAPGVGVYGATKAAVEVLTAQLAHELGPAGIRVNAVAPGLIVTEGTAAANDAERGRRRAAAVPLGRLGDPGDVADVVAFLVSPAARYVSGQTLAVDGGLSGARPPL